MMNDELGVVHPRVAGLDIHKGHITATVRLCEPTGGEPQCETHTFSALASGLAALDAWLTDHRIEAAVVEATGIYWHTPWQAAHRRDTPIRATAGCRPQRQSRPRRPRVPFRRST